MAANLQIATQVKNNGLEAMLRVDKVTRVAIYVPSDLNTPVADEAMPFSAAFNGKIKNSYSVMLLIPAGTTITNMVITDEVDGIDEFLIVANFTGDDQKVYTSNGTLTVNVFELEWRD